MEITVQDDADEMLPPQAAEEVQQQIAEQYGESSEYTCEVCGTALEYGGRGRKPKFCAEHRKISPRNSTRVSDDKWKEQLGNRLMRRAKATAELIARFDKTDAAIFWSGAPVLISSTIDWAESDPKIKKMLNSGLSKTASVDVMASALLILVPILMHHGMIPMPKKKEEKKEPESESEKVSADQGYGSL